MAAFLAPIRRKDTARGHSYVDAAGSRVPGSTTILGEGIPKPALVNWAADVTADYALNNWEALGDKPPAARLKELKGARWAENDKAKKRGTEVHGFAERLIGGEHVQVPDEIAGHVESCARFLDEFAFKPEHTEFSVASYRHGYAGTGDFIGTIELPAGASVPAEWQPFRGGRVRILGDWKTTRTGIFGETALQLASYRYADVLLTADGEMPMPAVDATDAIEEPSIISGTTASVRWRSPQKLTSITSRGANVLGTPAQLKSPLTILPILATASSM